MPDLHGEEPSVVTALLGAAAIFALVVGVSYMLYAAAKHVGL